MIGNRKNIIRFLVVGGTSTFIDFSIYMILSTQISLAISKLISMCCASVFSFLVNKKWTFENQEKKYFFLIIKYILAQCINIGTNVLINQIVFEICESKTVSFIIATGCAMCVNYMLQKYIVFRNKGNEE